MTRISLARYLFTRLRQVGVGSVHGVPGDFTLRALDHLAPSGFKWIGNANELNAAYAADGYARVKGISALFTTYGVGELSAINAVAGSFAENVAVVHIVGTPARELQRTKALLHHSLGNGNMRAYVDMYSHISARQVNLVNPETAPAFVDEAIEECLARMRPVYVELPSDMVDVKVSSQTLGSAIWPIRELVSMEATITSILEKLYHAHRPLILVDGLATRYGIFEELTEFARVTKVPMMRLQAGGGAIDETMPAYRGVHAGKFGRHETMAYAQSADLVLLFGPLLSDTNTAGWTAVPDPNVTITFKHDDIVDTEGIHHKIRIKELLQNLLKRLEPSKIAAAVPQPSPKSPQTFLKDLRPAESSARITQDEFWMRLNPLFRSGDTILVANGTPLVGARDFVLPPGVRFIASGIWLSVGHMLPAAQGVAQALKEQGFGRTILLEGDGSFQATAQELGTIIRHRLDVIIFLINNQGYAFERLIHGREAEYNDVAGWRYLEAAHAMGAPEDDPTYPVMNLRLETWGDLMRLLADVRFTDGPGLKMVEVMAGPIEVPGRLAEALAVTGRQLAAGADMDEQV